MVIFWKCEQVSVNSSFQPFPEVRKEKRLEHEVPVLKVFGSWLETWNVSATSKLGCVVTHAENQKPYMENYLLDERCSMSNNVVEASELYIVWLKQPKRITCIFICIYRPSCFICWTTVTSLMILRTLSRFVQMKVKFGVIWFIFIWRKWLRVWIRDIIERLP